MLAQCQEKNVVKVEKVATILNIEIARDNGTNSSSVAAAILKARLAGENNARKMTGAQSHRNKQLLPNQKWKTSAAMQRQTRSLTAKCEIAALDAGSKDPFTPRAQTHRNAAHHSRNGNSALDDVQGKAGKARLFVPRLHVEAGQVHGADYLVERDLVLL